jgi:hypothetical protein
MVFPHPSFAFLHKDGKTEAYGLQQVSVFRSGFMGIKKIAT